MNKNRLLKKLLLISVNVLVIIVVVLGVKVPYQNIFKKNVGPYSIESYYYGITLNNDNKAFYNISPYNSWVTPIFGQNKNVLNWTRVQRSLEFKKRNSPIYKYVQALLDVSNLRNPKISFESVKISSSINNNNVTFEYKLKNKKITSFTHILTFNDNDIIFDNSGQVLNNTDKNTLNTLNSFYGPHFKLSKLQSTTQLPTEHLYIKNLENQGVLKIDLKNIEKYNINTEQKLIELKTTQNPPKLKIHIYNNLYEIINND